MVSEQQLQVAVKRISAGKAFLLSLLLPGLGHLSCGKNRRALGTFLFWLGGLAVALFFSDSEAALGGGLTVSFVMYLFGFLDAYFTAREINSGLDVIIDENPRIAGALNLLTWGLGYFYLGARTKGLIFFIGGRFISQLPGWGMLVVLGIQIFLAWDAYRIAEAEVRRRVSTLLPGEELREETTQLPAVVPIGLAGALAFAVVLLSIVGLTMGDQL